MGCTSGFARDHVPPTLSRKNTAKNGAFHRPFDNVYGDTTIIATTCPWHPLPRPIRFLRSSADRGTSPTCRTTAGAHRPAAGSPGGAVRTPSLSVNNRQKFVVTSVCRTFKESHFNLSRTHHRLAPVPTYSGSHNSDAEGQIAAEIVPSPQLQLIELKKK